MLSMALTHCRNTIVWHSSTRPVAAPRRHLSRHHTSSAGDGAYRKTYRHKSGTAAYHVAIHRLEYPDTKAVDQASRHMSLRALNDALLCSTIPWTSIGPMPQMRTISLSLRVCSRHGLPSKRRLLALSPRRATSSLLLLLLSLNCGQLFCHSAAPRYNVFFFSFLFLFLFLFSFILFSPHVTANSKAHT